MMNPTLEAKCLPSTVALTCPVRQKMLPLCYDAGRTMGIINSKAWVFHVVQTCGAMLKFFGTCYTCLFCMYMCIKPLYASISWSSSIQNDTTSIALLKNKRYQRITTYCTVVIGRLCCLLSSFSNTKTSDDKTVVSSVVLRPPLSQEYLDSDTNFFLISDIASSLA